MNTDFASGHFTADTAHETIVCGFKPGFVELLNEDGDSLVWQDGMAAGTGIQTNATGPAITALGSDGITVSVTGFDVGQNEVNANTKAVYWRAWRRGYEP